MFLNINLTLPCLFSGNESRYWCKCSLWMFNEISGDKSRTWGRIKVKHRRGSGVEQTRHIRPTQTGTGIAISLVRSDAWDKLSHCFTKSVNESVYPVQGNLTSLYFTHRVDSMHIVLFLFFFMEFPSRIAWKSSWYHY